MKDTYMNLYTKLTKLQWLLQRGHMQNQAEHGPMGDSSRGQGRVLAMLKLQPEITTKDLSYLLGIRQQSLNELLNKLEKGGYVARVPSESDRRVMIVTLTDKGKSEEPPKADFSNIFGCLTEEEQATFSEYLDRMIAALEQQLGVEENDEMYQWMNAARERMDPDKFERLIAMHGGFRHPRGGSRQRDDDCFRHGPHDRGPHGKGPHNHGPHGRGRGAAPKDMPGSERFDPDYDGPLPDERADDPISSTPQDAEKE